MIFKIEKDLLQKALATVEGIVTPKNTETILANALMEIEKNQISLTTSDSDITIKTFLPVEMNQPGSMTIPVKRFSSIIRSMKSGVLVIRQSENNTLGISTEDEKISFTIMGSDAKDYPIRNVVTAMEMNAVPQNTFKKMIQKTHYAAAHNDESRFVFNGIYVEMNDKNLRFVATDGRRLAFIQEKEMGQITLDEGIIIPSKVISELYKILTTEGDVFFNVSNNQIFFRLNNTDISCRLIQGKFPDYEKVIPQSPQFTAIISKEDFIAAVRRVSLMANDVSHQIKLTFEKKNLTIEAQTPDIGFAKEEFGIDYSGKTCAVGFNCNYLLEAIKEMSSDEILIKFSDSEMPAIIQPCDSENYISVAMPIKI